MPEYKPAGYPSLSPYLVLSDPEPSLAFIERMFGGHRLRVQREEDGRIMHAEIRIGEAVLMMGQAMPHWPAGQPHFHLYVEDVDAVYRRALERGAEPVQEPVQKDDEDRRGGFRDPGGITWWIATQTGAA